MFPKAELYPIIFEDIFLKSKDSKFDLLVEP